MSEAHNLRQTDLSNEAPIFSARLGFLPPSVNKMYVHTKWGPKPSVEMRKFKATARIEIAKQLDLTAEPADGNSAHILVIDYFLPNLYNKGWPGKAKTRFKRRDVSNLVKVLEDVVAECLGIDDSCFVEERIRKLDGAEYGFAGLVVKVYHLG
jgi:Holliday junction resolvase RusA-like endonuclease